MTGKGRPEGWERTGPLGVKVNSLSPDRKGKIALKPGGRNPGLKTGRLALKGRRGIFEGHRISAGERGMKPQPEVV